MKIIFQIIAAVAAIGDFWREVNDATSSKAVLYNGMSKSKGNRPARQLQTLKQALDDLKLLDDMAKFSMTGSIGSTKKVNYEL